MLHFPVGHWGGGGGAAHFPGIFGPAAGSNLQPAGDFDYVYTGSHRLTQYMSGSFWFKCPDTTGVAAMGWGLENSDATGFFAAYNVGGNRFALELLCSQQEADADNNGAPRFTGGGSIIFVNNLDLVSDSDYMTGFDIWHHAAFYIRSNVTGTGVQDDYHFFHNGVEVSAYSNFDDAAGWLIIPDLNDWQSSESGRGDLYDSWWGPTKIITNVNDYLPAGSIAGNGLIGSVRPAVFLSGTNIQYQTNRGTMGVADGLTPDASAAPAFPTGAGPLALP